MSETPPSFFSRFVTYQRERFPFFENGLFLTAFVFSAISYSRLCRGTSGFIQWEHFVSAVISTVCFFFLLRIADEFKDREEDAMYRPHLPVPRGLISFRELRIMAFVALSVQLLVNLILSKEIFLLLLVPQLFFLLMWREFFAGNFLRKHWWLYVGLHMLFFPAVDIYTSGMDWFVAGEGKAPNGMLFFFAVSYMNGLVWEVGRKIKDRGNEEHNSYTRTMGMKKPVLLWGALLTLAYIFSLLAASFVKQGWLGFVLLTFLFLSSFASAVVFWKDPSLRNSKRIDVVSGGWGLFMYLILGTLPMLNSWITNL